MDGGDDQPRVRWHALARVGQRLTGAAILMFATSLAVTRFPLLPRSDRRWVLESLLRLGLVGYALALAGAAAGLVLGVASVLRARASGARAPRAARLALLCGTTLLSLGLAELTAGVWLAWTHRMPALPTRFEPDDGASHVVVLGGSTALGHPYNPNVSVGQLVSWELERALAPKRFRAEVLAFLGGALEDMHLKLAGQKQRPAAVLIFSGHNEFPSRFEEERAVSLDEAPRQPWLHTLYRASLKSPLCKLLYQTISRNRLDGPPPRLNTHKLIDEPMYTASEAAEVLANFRRRMEAIVAWCETVGALPVLLIEPGNESDYEPNRSLLPPTATAADRLRVETLYEQARAAEPTDSSQAETFYRELVAFQPGFAEGHFRLARVLEKSGRYDEAGRHYRDALDLDGMTFRATTEFQNVYREVAARHPQCVLVDGPAVLRSICPHGIISDDAMQDGVHPSLRGITALAEAVLGALRTREAFGWKVGPAPRLDPAEVAARAGMNPAKWASVCDWGRSFYRWVSGFRFDPSSHQAKADRFEALGKAVGAGEPPDATGFAPLSLRPLPPNRPGAP